MAKRNQDFEIAKGDHKQLVVDLLGEESIDYNEITWKLARTPKSPALIKKHTGNGITVSGGEFTIHLEPEDTAEIPSTETFHHDAILVDSHGNVSTIMTGTCTVFCVVSRNS